VIIGPSESGKTNLLAVLPFAGKQHAREVQGRTLSIYERSEAMRELAANAIQIIFEGQAPIPGTGAVTDHVFDLEVQGGNGLKRAERRFELSNADGGMLFPGPADRVNTTDEYIQGRKKLLTALREARGILICADCSSRATTKEFLAHFQQILTSIGSRTLKCERLVFCLTKADRLVAPFGAGALDMIERSDPAATCRRLIGEANINALRSYLSADARVVVGWSSVYGFDHTTGASNLDIDANALANRFASDDQASSAEIGVDDMWRPFRVHEPFVFLATGEEQNLKSLFNSDEERSRQGWRRLIGRITSSRRSANVSSQDAAEVGANDDGASNEANSSPAPGADTPGAESVSPG